MKINKKEIKVIFRNIEKDEGVKRVNDAFDLLFNEVFRIIKDKPIMATN